MSSWLLAQVATTLPMTGLIWFVQLVAYPLFASTGASGFLDYHAMHSRRITWIVAPLMTVELVAAIAWVLLQPGHLTLQMGGLILCVCAWLITAFVSVPAHHQLARGFDPDVHRRLLRSNWLRTVAWSLRSALLIWTLGTG